MTSVRRSVFSVAGALAVGALVVGVPAAAAGATDESAVIVSGLTAPSGLAVADDGAIYVSQLVPAALVEVSTGTPVMVGKAPSPITGVDVVRDGVLVYTRGGGDDAAVEGIRLGSRPWQVADLAAFEAEHNPDQANSYGFQDLEADCAVDVPATTALPGGGSPHSGEVRSNPAAVTVLPDGSRIVADGAGNAIIRVRPGGAASTVAVLPPVPVVVTPSVAAVRGFPGCAIGATLNLEPGPTDVELGPDGRLYVSTTPRAPGNGSTSAHGSVFAIDPDTGLVERVADGFRGASDLAVAPDGTIYVAELFGDEISVADGGSPVTFRFLRRPNALEYADGALYATQDFSFSEATSEVVTIFLR
jgi:hypothetical protein